MKYVGTKLPIPNGAQEARQGQGDTLITPQLSWEQSKQLVAVQQHLFCSVVWLYGCGSAVISWSSYWPTTTGNSYHHYLEVVTGREPSIPMEGLGGGKRDCNDGMLAGSGKVHQCWLCCKSKEHWILQERSFQKIDYIAWWQLTREKYYEEQESPQTRLMTTFCMAEGSSTNTWIISLCLIN